MNKSSNKALRIIGSVIATLLLVAAIVLIVFVGGKTDGTIDVGYKSKQYDNESKQYDNESKQYDNESKQYDNESKQYDNESKQYDNESKQYDNESKQYDNESKQYDNESKQYDNESKQYDNKNTSGQGNSQTESFVLSDADYELFESDRYNVKVNIGHVTVLATDEDYPYIRYLGDEKINLKTWQDDGGVNISIDMKDKVLNFSHWDEKYTVEIYLPEKLSKLETSLDAGNLEISGIEIQTLEADISAGNAAVKDCKIENADISVDAGNASFYADETTKSIVSDVDMGNINVLLPRDISGFKVSYKANLGNFSNKTNLAVSENSEGFVGDKKGVISYGDSSLYINAKIEVGNMMLKLY